MTTDRTDRPADDLADAREAIAETFPRVETIADDRLREGTIDAWAIALVDNGMDDLETAQWYPTRQKELGTGDELLIDHVQDVTELSIEMAHVMSDRRPVDVSLDLLITGALVHDVSKVYEYAGYDPTPIYDLLGHPYYGVASVAMARLPPEVAHIVLAHSPLTAVEPATIEALIVRYADEVATAGIKLTQVSDLRDV